MRHTEDKNTEPDFGVLYIATGAKYVHESLDSARSVRQWMPDVPIVGFVDKAYGDAEDVFDQIQILANPTFKSKDKIGPLARSPFRKTLFLDSDTVLVQPVYELCEVLDRFELAFCHAPWRTFPGFDELAPPDYSKPDWLPEANTGVILYRTGQAFTDFVAHWIKVHEELYETVKFNREPDQPSFRKTLIESDILYTVLPPEYNLRPVFPHFAGGNAKVKIVHGRGYPLRKAIKKINARNTPRVDEMSKLDRVLWKKLERTRGSAVGRGIQWLLTRLGS
jgi:hypothetical protein